MIENQRTLKKEISLSGKGLHSGQVVNICMKPAEVNHGFKFMRTDVEGHPIIPADVNRVLSTQRGTTIGNSEVHVSTIEHALSALAGLQVDNVLIELDGPEVPILDGSAKPFLDAILAVGIEEQDAQREVFIVEENIQYVDEATGTEITAVPCDHFELTVMIDFNSPVLGQQYAHMNDFSEYPAEIAPCRTFVFVRELEHLMDQNLIKGGDLNNSIVIADRKMSQEELNSLAKKLNRPGVEIDKEGIINTVDLYFKNEPARHKLLDVIGDLSLLGKPIRGKILAKKPGHTSNAAFTKILKEKFIKQRKLKGKPKYNPAKKAIFDTVAIQKLLPHRYPFLLVDKIVELNENSIVGVKSITFTESFFQGHFPGNPVFPGVLQIEAMAQTGGVLVLSQKEEPEKWDTYFIKIDNFKFKSLVRPGDSLVMKMELTAPVRRGICQMYATAYVGDTLVSEGELTAQILKRT